MRDSPRGVPEWDEPPYYPGGAVTAQAADSTMAKNMSFDARAGYPCGEDFIADKFLKEHPEFDWQTPGAAGHEGQSLGRVQGGGEAVRFMPLRGERQKQPRIYEDDADRA